jgi:hypothetical protein
LIVGIALIEKYGYDFPTWDNRKSTASAEIRAWDLPLELEVSKTIGAMPFLWLQIDDEPGKESERGYIERNAIALLSNYDKDSIDPPSKNWLGLFCNRSRVRNSGLWNYNHVDESIDPEFLERFQELVEAQT